MNKIVRHSYGISKERDELELNRLAFENAKQRKNLQSITESNTRIAEIDKRSKDQEFIRRRVEQNALERAVESSSNTILEQGKLYLFKNIIAEAYVKSLILDEYFVKEHRERFVNLVSDYVDNNGKYKMLENAVKANPIPLLKEIKEICDSFALEASRRIGKEMRETKELGLKPIFELDEDETSAFEERKGELNIDRLAELVKKKVLTVVKDEKDRQSKEKELLDDLKQRAEETGEEVEAKPALGTATLKESTLFNSIMHNVYIDHLKIAKEHYIKIEDNDDVREDEESDLSHSKNKHDDGILSTDDLSKPVDTDIDLEVIMAESITYYTLMELTDSICLETFTRREIMNMSHKMMNKR